VDIKKFITGLVGGGITDVMAKTLLGYLITGTSVSDQLMQSTLPVIIFGGGFAIVLRFFRGA